MNHIMAICDMEEQYAAKLADYLNMKEGFPFEVRYFTSAKKLLHFSERQRVEIALVSEELSEELGKSETIEHMIFLHETVEFIHNDVRGVYKYQSCENLIQQVLGYLEELSCGGSILRRKTTMKLIGLYSPVRRNLQTTFAFTLGQILARKSRVLYINLESFSGLGRMLEKNFSKDLSDILYYMKNGKTGLPCLLGSVVESINGLDILPPMLCQMDLINITSEEWLFFLSELEKNTEYEYMILDLSDSVQGLFEILRQCSHIYTLTGDDAFALAKARQYEEMLQQCKYEDVIRKTRQCQFPRFSYLPPKLDYMGMSELAKIIRRYIQEDYEGAVG